MGAEREAQACAAFYGPGGLCPAALSCVQSLRRFAGSSAKRCRDRSLEEALELARAASEGLGPLGDAAARPLLRCLLAFQAEATGSSSAFQKLEQMVAALAAGREALLSRELAALLDGLLGRAEVLPPGDLQSVCMFIEESSLGRLHWRQNLAPLLRRLAATLAWVLRSPPAGAGRWGYLAVKACLQLFQALPRDVAPLAWSEAERSETLRSVLGLLLQVVTGQAPNKDTRLLAGTALSMLVNTAPRPARGASAARALCRLADQGVEELRFGELTVEATSILEPDGLERLVLTRGLLTCCKTDILSCQLESFTHQACLLLDVLFPAVCTLCKEQKDCQYYCFQVFSLWLQRLQECLPEIWCLKGSRILAEDSDLLGQLTQLVWSNAETPVEGVSEFIHSSFRLLLEIYCLECRHFEDQERPLYRQMLQRVISMPWQAKARYVPLCAIVPYVGSEQVLDAYRDLPQHLLSCLATNRLCPAAAEVYKAVVQQQRTEWLRGPRGPEEALAERWALHWLPLLSQALRSPVPILQSNAANHLLPWTLRLLPASYAPLAAEFGGRDAAALRAWVALLRAHKSITGTLAAEGETRERLSRCLHAGEEGVRLAALELLCCSPSTSRALSGTEVRLLREFLPLNLNGDSSAFRQLLQAAVKKALVRLRDSSLARLRGRAPRGAEPGAGAEPLAQAVSFVEWLLQLSVSSLTPGSNYQRKKTALLLLAVVLETCTDTWSPERRKGQPPKTMAVLLSYARHQGCWDFFSQPNLLALLSCLQDSTNEIRDLASELLVRYFPAPLPEPVALALFQLAQEALSSPRVQEAEAGAVLMETILQKSDSSTLRSLSLEAGAAPTPQPRGLCFAQHLLRVLQAQYAAARQDLLQAAATKPMHGVIAALRRCLLQVPEVAVSMRAAEWAQSWQEFLTSLVATARDITSFLLGALQSGQGPSSDQQATAPSFADMGNAIGSLIMLGKGQGQREDDSVLLSEEHSLILTCCWVSVKEIGLLLGGLAELLLSPAPAGPASPLPLASLQTAAEVFREILLRCRHWGAVEGCSVGFTKFCAALLNHAEAELRAIPPAMLAQGLEALSGPRSSSITRRAAGFPMLFLCIVSAEAPAPARPLLARCIEALLALAASALPRDWDQTLDLPQVGSAVLHQTIACFLCSEAARLADEESISSACSLLQEPNADVQFALLSWVIKEEGGKCDALEKALRITLLENLQSVLQDRRNKEFLKLYLEALMHLCRNLTSWSEDASSKFQGSSSTCMEILLLMMETEEPGPDLLFQALYATSLLLTLSRSGDEAQLLVERWCVILEKCSKCVSSEVLRLAAARSLQLAGVDVVQRCQGAACPSLVPVALRLINVGIHLLQDEEQEVRHEASNFASLVHRVPGEQVRDGYIFVQANTGLLGLLQLLLEKFGDHPETFSSLLQHLPLMDLRGILEELKANKASSLYKEDEPNVFAEPAVLSQLLLPFLLQLLEKASVSCPLRESALCWLEATGPSILRDLQYCKHQWSQEAAGPWWMKALGCAKLHTAVAVLLARAKLLVRALEVVHGSTATAPGLGCSAHELQQELALVQGLLARHGLAPGPGWGDGLREPGPPSGAA
ncbi:uncharacterized protein LOC134148231 isoform X2 [Rhea pennata]|uniref:uncharacterized protein LOC134148231 isoform X2 n=1 Tax=Rhea pennata TaxID=8795 RepID=UPI002E275AF8